jgi:hypothetical protein
MATLQEELAQLKAIKRSGVLRSLYEGKTVEYRSMADLDRAIADLEAEIAGVSGNGRPRAMTNHTAFHRADR